jgi:uncharacterized protein with PQ loop repeat
MFAYQWVELLGVILCSVLSIFIFKTIYDIKKDRVDLDNLNEYIFLSSLWNAFNWMVYSIVVNDIILFWSCVLPLQATLQICFIIFKSKYSKYFEAFLCAMITYSLLVVFCVSFFNGPAKIIITGSLGTISCILYSAIPLQNAIYMIKNKTSIKLYKPVTIISFISSVLWLTFSFMVKDIYQIVTNTVSFILSCIQLFILIRYPPNPHVMLV